MSLWGLHWGTAFSRCVLLRETFCSSSSVRPLAGTELEQFLAECISDVRRDITLRWSQEQETASRHAKRRTTHEATIANFEAADRQKVMELLLSQERVIKCAPFPDVRASQRVPGAIFREPRETALILHATSRTFSVARETALAISTLAQRVRSLCRCCANRAARAICTGREHVRAA